MTAGAPPIAAELAEWAAAVRIDDIPDRVVELGLSQVISQLAAIRAGLRHQAGAKLLAAYGPLDPADPAGSAPLLAALGSWLNLDDTAYAGHLGSSTVAVPLAWARAGRLDGRALLAAVVVADECAARITAAATLGPLRGQSALHTLLAGAVAGRLHAEGAPARRYVDAFGLAFAAPPWPIMHAFLGGDAKLLHAFTPVRAAMDACAAATAGLAGLPDLLEHPRGFLARFATVPLPGVVTAGLSRRWHTDSLSFKLRPGGPGVDAAVDCAIDLHPEIRGTPIEEVTVTASAYTVFAGRQAESYLDGARTPLSSLLLSTGYPVATALLDGDLKVSDFEPPASGDPQRWSLAGKVRLVHDPAMTRDLLASAAPFGAAVCAAGERGQAWLEDFIGDLAPERGSVPPVADDLTAAVKATPARLTVRLADGRVLTRERTIPLGAAGPDTRVRHRELVRRKFLDQGGDPDVAAALDGLRALPAPAVAELLGEALGGAPVAGLSAHGQELISRWAQPSTEPLT